MNMPESMLDSAQDPDTGSQDLDDLDNQVDENLGDEVEDTLSDASEDDAGNSPDTSLANQDPNPTQPQAQAQETPDQWAKRYRDLQSFSDRRMGEFQRQLQERDRQLQELQRFREEQTRRAEEQNLKRWMPRHPEHGKFQNLLERARAIDRQLRALPQDLDPETRQAAEAAITSAVSPEEQQELMAYQGSIREFQTNFFADPVGSLMPMLQPVFQEMLEQREMQLQARMEVERELQDPALRPLVEQHAPEIQQALNDGVPYSYAVHMTKMFGELQSLRAKMSELQQPVSQAREQARLARGRAAHTRTPAAPSADPYEVAKAEAARRGFSTDSPQFLRLLTQLSE